VQECNRSGSLLEDRLTDSEMELSRRGGTNQYFSIIGMLGTVPDSYLFQIPVIKYLLPPHTVLVIGPALDSVQNSR
jgi:hypothetical protein